MGRFSFRPFFLAPPSSAQCSAAAERGSVPAHSPMPDVASGLPQAMLPPAYCKVGLLELLTRVLELASISWYITRKLCGLPSVSVPSTARTVVAAFRGQS